MMYQITQQIKTNHSNAIDSYCIQCWTQVNDSLSIPLYSKREEKKNKSKNIEFLVA